MSGSSSPVPGLCKRRVAVFCPSLIGGGAERSAIFIGKTLEEAGYAVDLVIADNRGELVDDPFVTSHLVDLGVTQPLLALPAYLRYLRREKPDLVISLVHSANFMSGIGAWRVPDVPVIVGVHNTLVKQNRDQWWIRRWFGFRPERFLYRHVRIVQAVSEELANQSGQLFDVPHDKLRVTYNSALMPKTEQSEPVETSAEELAEIEALSPYLVSVGRLAPIKHFDLLIDAFARARLPANWRLVLVGDGPEKANLQSQIETLKLQRRVVLAGYRSPVTPWMERARGFLFASRGEGFGLVVHEALLAGLPIAATACPGVNEVLDYGELGRLVPQEDADALARAMEDIAAGRLAPPKKDILDAQLEKFSPEAVAARYVAMVEEVIGPAAGSD